MSGITADGSLQIILRYDSIRYEYPRSVFTRPSQKLTIFEENGRS